MVVNMQKIVGIVAVVVAVAGAFIGIPQVEAILLVLGLYVGFFVPADAQVRVLVSALVLNTLAHTFDVVPGVGHYLVLILSNVGIVYVGIAVMIVLRNLYARLMA
jgi:hypothetical protein